jgi:hypothetical protein
MNSSTATVLDAFKSIILEMKIEWRELPPFSKDRPAVYDEDLHKIITHFTPQSSLRKEKFFLENVVAKPSVEFISADYPEIEEIQSLEITELKNNLIKNLIFERLLPNVKKEIIKTSSEITALELENMSKEQYAATWLYSTKVEGSDAANEVIRLLTPNSENPNYEKRELARFKLRKMLPEIFPNLGAKPRL